jgi:selenophosphate synthase
VAEAIQWNDASAEQRAFLLDPQTSGGLLIALPHVAAQEFRSQFPPARVVGSVVARGEYPPLVIA